MICLSRFLYLIKEFFVCLDYLLKGEPIFLNGIYLLSNDINKFSGKKRITKEIKKDIEKVIKQDTLYSYYYHILTEEHVSTQICEFRSSNIYIYSLGYNSTFKICGYNISYKNFETIQEKIPSYLGWFGYKSLHFELFGSYFNFSSDKLIVKMSFLPLGSTVSVIAATNHIGIRKVSDEIIAMNHTSMPYENNPYFRFIRSLIYNPDNSYIFIKHKSEVSSFATNIDELENFSIENIVKWQQNKIKNFLKFYYEKNFLMKTKSVREFNEFVQLYLLNISENELAEPLKIFQEQNISRYKELLFFNLISKNNFSIINSILKSNIDVDCVLKDGTTPILIAVSLFQERTVKLLIDYKANTNTATHTKLTPLMEASRKGYLEIAKLLIDNHGNISAMNIDGNTALIFAACNKKYEIVELLLNSGANMYQVNYQKQSAFTCAMELGDLLMVRLLLSYGFDLSSINYISFPQNIEISQEISKFEKDPVTYVLYSNHEVVKLNSALNNLKSYANVAYINNVQENLFNFKLRESYNDLQGTCHYIYENDHYEN